MFCFVFFYYKTVTTELELQEEQTGNGLYWYNRWANVAPVKKDSSAASCRTLSHTQWVRQVWVWILTHVHLRKHQLSAHGHPKWKTGLFWHIMFSFISHGWLGVCHPQEHMTPAKWCCDMCVDATLTCTTYLSIIRKPAHRCMETTFPDDCVIWLQHIELLPRKRNGLGMV